jgi:translation initiation factor 2 subunit 3
MATMLAGASVMDASLLLIAANETCPQPQTSEHLAAVEIMKLNEIIILQNKIDTVIKHEGRAAQQHEDIVNFIKGSKAEKSPIIPISGQLGYNIDVLCDYICRIPIPLRDFTSPPLMTIVRSFDVNTPGTSIEDIKGGVCGGSLLQGILRVGDKVEIRPGFTGKSQDGRRVFQPIVTRITSLQAEKNELLYAVPGGLIAVGLMMDPSMSKNDKLTG